MAPFPRPDRTPAPDAELEAGTESPTRAGHLVRPRRSLPSGRAVVGGLLVTVAALGTFLAARGAADGPGTGYVVATRPLDTGERIDPGELRIQSLDLPNELAAQAFNGVEELEGAVALAPLRPDELVQRSAVLPSTSGGATAARSGREFSFSLPRDHAVDGTLNRGERVDLLATYGRDERAVTTVVVRDATVTRIDNRAESGIGGTADVTVTLALADADEVLRATHATDVATVTLVRATRSVGTDPGPDRYAGPSPATDPALAGPDGGS